jgi:F-type H+-transporting ATPase subunit b
MNPLVQPDPGLYIWTIVVFLGLLWAFNKLAWTPLKAALETREQSIQKALDDARQARQELEKLNVESSRILAEARIQADQVLSETRDDASRLREELRQKAQAESQGIVKNAQRQIELETARAVQQIRAETVDLSLAMASKILQRNISKEDNERFIEETFKQIEASRRPS